jgi:hypothetical protein
MEFELELGFQEMEISSVEKKETTEIQQNPSVGITVTDTDIEESNNFMAQHHLPANPLPSPKSSPHLKRKVFNFSDDTFELE